MRLLRHRIEKSRAIISQMLSLSSNPYLALSFGKDSLVMLDLVMEQYPDIPCIFSCSTETRLLDKYQELMDWYINNGVNLIVSEFDRYTLNQDKINITGTATDDDFNMDVFFDGWDGMFMGLRIEESKARRITLISKKNNEIGDKIMQYKTGKRAGMYRCCPMAYWKSFDVLFYLKGKGLPFLDAYQDGHKTRTSTMITSNSLNGGILERMKRQNIERYNKLMIEMPELKYFKI